MPLALNTSHALYPNLLDLIAVEGGAFVSLKTARTFTNRFAPTFGSGAVGAYAAVGAGGYDWAGATFTPGVSIDLVANNFSILTVVADVTGKAPYGTNAADRPMPGFLCDAGGILQPTVNNLSTLAANLVVDPGATSALGAAYNTIVSTRDAGDGPTGRAFKTYKNGVLQASGTSGVYVGTTIIDAIGGSTGYQGSSSKVVYVALFNKLLTPAEQLDLHNSLGASNTFALLASADTTAPTLSSPTGTATGATTASGTVSTNEGNGTLYRLVSTSATATLAAVKAGVSQAVTATGVQNVTVTGLTASTVYYLHYAHTDAALNDSAVATSASFTTSAAANVNLALTLDAAVFAGLASVSPLTVLSITTADAAFSGSASVAASGILTLPALKNNTGTLLINQAGATVYVYAITGAHVVTKTAQTTNASGIMTITDPLLVAATQYRVVVVLGTGAEGMDKVTAT